MSDELRERIAEALRRETDNGGNRTEDYAQAVIDELGLTANDAADGPNNTQRRYITRWFDKRGGSAAGT